MTIDPRPVPKPSGQPRLAAFSGAGQIINEVQ
jgi:hypothetical protein